MGNDGLVENSTTQMRRGVLEYCILLILASGDEYASSIIQKLKDVDIIVSPADQAQEAGPAHLPLGGIHTGTSAQVLYDNLQGQGAACRPGCGLG